MQTVVILLTGSNIGTGTLCFICGALFGILCYRRIRQTKTLPQDIVSGVVASNPPNVPIYEDIILDESAVTIELSRNIAYEQVQKT